MTIHIIASAALIMVASLAGVVFIWKGLGTWMRRHLKHLVTFSAGVFLVISFTLTEEALHLTDSTTLALGGMAFGALLLEILSRIIPGAHHHHSDEHDHSHTHIDARRMLAGDAIHNVADGLLLVPAFLIDLRLGIATAGAIFIHELVQEISEFFVLKEAGLSTKQALARNFLVSATIFIGVGIGLMLTSAKALEGPLVAIAAGGFLYVVFRDLLPSSLRDMKESKKESGHLIALALGMILMLLVGMIVPHEHPEDEHGGSEDIFESV